MAEIREIEHIRNSDDVFLSMYFSSIDIPFYMRNPLSDLNPYAIASTPGSQFEALSKLGHVAKYGEAFTTLSRILQNHRI